MQVIDDLRLPFRAAPLQIGILHPEEEFAPCGAGHVMGKDSGIGMAQMQGPGWRRGEPGAKGHWLASHPAKLSLARSV